MNEKYRNVAGKLNKRCGKNAGRKLELECGKKKDKAAKKDRDWYFMSGSMLSCLEEYSLKLKCVNKNSNLSLENKTNDEMGLQRCDVCCSSLPRLGRLEQHTETHQKILFSLQRICAVIFFLLICRVMEITTWQESPGASASRLRAPTTSCCTPSSILPTPSLWWVPSIRTILYKTVASRELSKRTLITF